jgi:hypothetical protein
MPPISDPAEASAGIVRAATRNAQLDVWRGLCLVDVVLVHLAYNDLRFPEPLDALIKHYTRFAAGGFVFLAGLTIATVFEPRYTGSATDRRGVRRWLWRRALVLLAIDVLASSAYCLLDAVRRFPVHDGAAPLAVAREVAALQRPGVTGGIFVLYAALLAATPALFALRRRAGDAALAALSIALYAACIYAAPALDWPRNSFPIGYWQPLFVAGLLSRDALRWVACDRRRRRVWATCAAAAFALVFLAAHGPTFGIVAVRRAVALSFDKQPLQPGALLWYLGAVQLVLAGSMLVSGRWLFPRHLARALALLGRHSLLVYTAHVFSEAAVMEYVWGAWPSTTVRVVVAAIDLMALAGLCCLVEAGARRRTATLASRVVARSQWRAAPALAIGAAAAVVALALTDLIAARRAVLPVEALRNDATIERVSGADAPSAFIDDALYEPGRERDPGPADPDGAFAAPTDDAARDSDAPDATAI